MVLVLLCVPVVWLSQVLLMLLCVPVGWLWSVRLVFAVGVVVLVVLCICWAVGVGGTCKGLPLVQGTLLVVRGGGCRILQKSSVVVVAVCFGGGRLLPSSSLLDCRGTGRREVSFLRMPGALRKVCCSARCCTSGRSCEDGSCALDFDSEGVLV